MFRALFVWTLVLSFSANAEVSSSKFNLELAKEHCLTKYTDSSELFMGEFKWGYTLLEMADTFEGVYQSGKRIGLHGMYQTSDDSFYLYLRRSSGDKPVKINANFIKSVTLQIETAIEKGFADFVFFPDMGHSHLYFPKEHWQKSYIDSGFYTSAENHPKLYEKMFADKEMKALYHLTEQLQMLDDDKNVLPDEILSFKYWNRNFVGFNNGTTDYEVKVAPKDKTYNTVNGIEGHKSWSAGFAVSASKDGCFPYRDKDGITRFFDISLHDPRYDPAKMQNAEY